MGIYLDKIQSHYVHSRATYPILDFPAVKPRVPVRKFQLLMSMRFSIKSMKYRYINIWPRGALCPGLPLQIHSDSYQLFWAKEWSPQLPTACSFGNIMSTNNPVVKVEGRRPETLTTGLFVLSIPGMETWQTYSPSLIKFESLVDPGNPKTCLSIKNSRNNRPLAKTVHCINYRYCMTPTIRGA